MARERAVARVAAVLGVVLLVAGCGTGATVPPASPTPSRSAAPAGTPPATPGASASPPATSQAIAAIAVLDGLRAFTADDSMTYRVSFRGDSRHSTDILAVKGILDIAGRDASIQATFTFPGQGTGRSDYRRVGARDWLRFDGGEWRGVSGLEAELVVDPLAGTHDGTRMQYLGPVADEDGLHQVQLTGLYLHPVLIPAGNLTAEKVTRTRLVVVTDAAGIPVRGTWSMHGQGRVSGQLQAIGIDLDLTWSKIGEPLTIREP